ncbi:MAG: mechanosensitive ion channel family protein [Methylocystis sp.]|nr:mechanosensitive ion channel family protein [Methylocystis sp.]MCA3583943.1 mechanosensitive ion channel family protein [Methylocystis sp.]MCA3592447.1 mechanosensitive ion channel family protein [Methylocystis sp.]
MSLRSAAAAALSLLLLVLASGLSLQAQTDVRAQLDRIRTEITAFEKEVQANLTNDKGLAETRAKLEPLQNQLRMTVAAQTPILEGIKARLDQLGPGPDAAKGQTENADVARERLEQEKAQRDTEGLLALARNHLVAIEQLSSRITDQRRTLLTRALLERTDSIFSPLLWANIVRALPGEFRSLQFLFAGWFVHLQSQLDGLRLGLLALAVLLLAVVAVPGHRYLRRFEARPVWPPAEGEPVPARPSRKQRALAALRVTIIWAVVPVMVCAGIYNLLDAMNLITERMDGFVHTLLFGVALVAFAHGLADGILGPDNPAWRLVDLDDRAAGKIANLAKAFPTIIVIGKTLEALMQAIYAVLPVTVGGKALIALLGALTIIRTLRGLRSLPEAEIDDPAQAQPSGGLFTLVRVVAWAAAGIMLISVALGYVALGSFIQDQIIWLAMVGGVLLILVALVDEYIGYGISPEGKVGRQVMQEVGLSKGSLKQISILANGFFRVVLFIAAAMLALAPWGLDSGDTLGTLRAALFGFTVGGVTISLSNIILAIVLFGLGFSITKAVKVWLEKSYLPHTKLDVGLRNSIATSIGYLGIIIATVMAASTLGFSLDKFTIVAGALSVGIGFGLQSIVNNFVSGLILLWERPIRVGDWIVVGEEQGIVKKINVRSTQIETFDRASLIVPNSEFISGRVKNWMHNDRTARVVIPIGVGYGSDPDRVRKILLDVAKASKDVLREPVPRVYFMRLGETSMDFELRCFTDVDTVLPTKSELLFQIHKQLAKARIDIPMPMRPREWLEPPREEGDLPDEKADRSSARGA